MNALSVTRINIKSPYTVWFDNGLYHFKTDNDVLLAIEFEEDETLSFKGSVWLNLINLSRKNSPTDPKVKRTVITIIDEFFRLNPTVILYLCDTANNQQAMRSRLFLHWFNDAESKALFHIQVAEIQDEDVGKIGLSRGLSPWLEHGHLHTMSSYSLSSVCMGP